jgi:hypothetical protein
MNSSVVQRPRIETGLVSTAAYGPRVTAAAAGRHGVQRPRSGLPLINEVDECTEGAGNGSRGSSPSSDIAENESRSDSPALIDAVGLIKRPKKSAALGAVDPIGAVARSILQIVL